MAGRGVLGLVVALAGCYEPPRDACKILCTPGAPDACPADMTCEGGYCVAPGGVCTTALAMVRVGGRHACGLDAAGHALCWGDGHEGQLGVAAINDFVATPTQVADTTWIALATGNEHTCAIKPDHTVWCWGQNDFGEARGVHGGIANVPAQVVGPATMPAFDSISAGGAHSCAIGAGQLWCWGRANSVGLAAETTMMTHFAPAIADFVEVSAGVDHTCAISRSMGLMCFGNNDAGQASGTANTPTTVTTPTVIDVGLPVGQYPIHIAGGDSKNCVIMGDTPDATSGALWCWGFNNFKDVGAGNSPALPAKQIVPEVGWTQVSTGAQVACGVRDHQAYCWGTENQGGLGDGVWTVVRTPAQAIALGSADEVYVATQTPDASQERGYDELACLRDGDQVRCWGSNGYGDAANGTAALRPKPIQITSPNGSVWSHVWLGDDHTCGQTSDGALWCWGADTLGAITAQLGHGTVDQPCTPTGPCDFPRPTATPAPVVPETVAIGTSYTCALQAGAITCWGTADKGVLGASRSTPGVNTVTPPAGQQWDRLFGANVASCGRTTGGIVSCWGHVISTDRTSPTAINDPLLADLATLQFGDGFACGAQASSNGRVCWGDNNNGQLGDGMAGGSTTAPMLYPEPVVSTASHNGHSCALTPAGQIQCWGSNGRGQCGQPGAMQQIVTPTLVSGAGAPLGACTRVATGASFSCAICDNAPWCWGDNTGYQLGRGDTQVSGGFDEAADRVAVPPGTYTEIAAGLYAACAIDSGGALYCWGYGGHGELGDGSHASNLPALIVPVAN